MYVQVIILLVAGLLVTDASNGTSVVKTATPGLTSLLEIKPTADQQSSVTTLTSTPSYTTSIADVVSSNDIDDNSNGVVEGIPVK